MVFRCLRKSARRVENCTFPLYWSRLCGEDRHCTPKNPTSLGTATEHVSTFSFPLPSSDVVTLRFLPWNGHFLGVFFRFPLILRPSQSNWSALEPGFECTRVAAFRPMGDEMKISRVALKNNSQARVPRCFSFSGRFSYKKNRAYLVPLAQALTLKIFVARQAVGPGAPQTIIRCASVCDHCHF